MKKVSWKDIGLVNTRRMFKKAMEGKYAIPAYNFNNMEQHRDRLADPGCFIQEDIQAVFKCDLVRILLKDNISNSSRQDIRLFLNRQRARQQTDFSPFACV